MRRQSELLPPLDLEPEKFEANLNVQDPRLLRMQLHAERREHPVRGRDNRPRPRFRRTRPNSLAIVEPFI